MSYVVSPRVRSAGRARVRVVRAVIGGVVGLVGLTVSPLARPASAVGNTYVVSTTGNDANPGTAAAPWRTVNKALGASSPAGAGDTVLIKAGSYNEDVVNTKSGTAAQRLTITGETGTVIHPTTGVDKGYGNGVFTTKGTHDLVIQNLTLTADTATMWAGLALGDVTNVTVQAITVSGTWAPGIIVYPDALGAGHTTSFNVKILNNTLTNVNTMTSKLNLQPPSGANCVDGTVTKKCDQESLSVWGVDGFEVANNILDGGSKEGLDIKDGSKNGTVHHNNISHQARVSSTGAGGVYAGGGGPALYIDGGAAELANVNVFDNIVHDNFADGIVVSDEDNVNGTTHDIHVYNNIVYNNQQGATGTPLNSCLMTKSNVNLVVFENNTCHNNGWSIWVQKFGTGSPSNVTFRNNLISASRKDPASLIQPGPTNIALQNTIVAPGTPGPYNPAGFVNSNNKTIAAAGFVNAAGADFHLAAGSGAIDAGATVQFATVDFDGKTRPAGPAPDVGAFEFGAGGGGGGGTTTLYSNDFSTSLNNVRPWIGGSVVTLGGGVATMSGTNPSWTYGPFCKTTCTPADPLGAGTLKMSFDAKNISGTTAVQLYISWWDSATGGTKTDVIGPLVPITTTATNVSWSAVLPATAVRAQVSGWAAGGTWQADNLLVTLTT